MRYIFIWLGDAKPNEFTLAKRTSAHTYIIYAIGFSDNLCIARARDV